MFDLDPAPQPADMAEVRRTIERLAAAGFQVPDRPDLAERFLKQRADYAGDITALARYLGGNRAELMPGQG
jgi:hypothetical protein